MVITLALLVLFLTVFFAGGIERMFSPKVELQAQIQDVKGLRNGSPVWLSGIEIGSVKEIKLHPDHGTLVTLSIKKSALPFVRKDSHVSVLTIGLLGDKYIELSAGSQQAGPAGSGDTLKESPQIELKEIMETSATSIQKMTEFLKKVESLVSKIDTGHGSMAKLISDPALYDNLAEATKTLSLAVKDLRVARGSLKLLIEDPSLYNKMLAAASSLEDFGKKLNDSSGTIGKLIEDPSLYNRMLATSSSMAEFSRKLNEGSGSLRRLAEDPVLYENLNKASLQLSSILERIDRGEGVAGKLVGDQELAAELAQIIEQTRELVKDMRENPRRYFTINLF